MIVGRARGADVNILLIGEGGIRRATSFEDLCFIGAGGVRFALQLRITLYELQIKIELTASLGHAIESNRPDAVKRHCLCGSPEAAA